MENPLSPSLQKLFDRLAFLNGLIAHLKNQHNNYLPLLVKAFERENLDPSLMAAGISLVIRDLTQPVNGFRGVYPVGASVSRNLEEYQQILETVMLRNSAWTVAQAYESFDTFLKDISAEYYQNNDIGLDQEILNDLIPSNKKSRELSSMGLTQNDLLYWRKCIGYARWNNAKILSVMRNKIAPKLKLVEQENQHIINFDEWFDCISEVRHAVTHSNGVIKQDKYKSSWSQNLLGEYFPGNHSGNGYDLQLSENHVEKNLQTLAEYGFVIYKCLSEEQDYPVDFV